MPSLTTELFVRLLDGITKPATAAARALRGIGRAQDEVNARPSLGQRLADASAANTQQLDALRGRMVDAAAAGYLLARGLASPISSAIEFESAMADVRKVVDFPTPQAFKQMGDDIIAMSRRIPIAAQGLAEIVAAAGQAGIAGDELTEFTEGAAKIGVALDISAGEAGDAMAKLRTALGYSNQEVFLLADAMNHLSNAQASSAAEILDVVRRVGAQAQLYGYSAEQTAAFASAMISAGAESEVAATSFRNMGMALTRGASATKRQDAAFKELGLNAEAVAKRMQQDAVGTTVDVLKRIAALPKEIQGAISSDLFGNEARALGPLLTNLELVESSMGLVAKQTLYAGSAQKEFEVRSKTTANAIQLFKNNVGALGITIGNALIPTLNQAMEAVAPMLTAMADFAAAHPELTKNVILATSAIVALRVATIGLRFATAFAKGGILDLALGLTNIGTGAKNAGKALARPFVGYGQHVVGVTQIAAMRFRMMWREISTGGAGAAVALQGTAATMGRALIGLLNPMALVRGAMTALKLALIGTGIGAIVVGIAAAGVWIYENWSGIGEMFSAFGSAFMAALGPAAPIVQGLVDKVSGLVTWVRNLLGPIDESGESWRAWGTAAGQAVGSFVADAIGKAQDIVNGFLAIPGQLMGLATDIAAIFTSIDYIQIGKDMISALWEGIKSMMGQLGSYVKSQIASMFTINWPWSSGGDAPAPANDNSSSPQKFARGGPIKKGQTGIVGDGGEPEFFTAGADGYITPFSKVEPIGAGGSGGGGARGGSQARGPASVNFQPQLTIAGNVYGVDDLERRFDEFARRMKADFDQQMAGTFSDAGAA